jgi:predicted Zn-dependent peptidase
MLCPRHQTIRLSNGLRIVTEEIPYVRSVALGIWITVGSRDENEANNGISHFLEHILFKGTKNRNTKQIAESLESVGGSLDAFTTKELTCYAAHVLDEHLPLAIEVLSDIILNSIFDPIEIEKEKEVILTEINHYKDTPEEMVFEHFYQNIFPSHPLGFHIYGTEPNIKKFFRDQLLDFIHEQYATNRIVISGAGNLKHEQLVSLIEKYFTDLPVNKARQFERVVSIKGTQNIILDHCSQAHVCFGTRAYPYSDERKFPLMMLNTHLGGGMSSILFQKIREEYGLVYSIYSFHDFAVDSGVFGIYFSTDEKNVSSILEIINQELDQLRSNSIGDANLTKIKNQLKGNLLLALESTSARMNRLAKNEIYLNRHYTLDDVVKKIDSVTTNDIWQVADNLFNEQNYFTTILKPEN